MLKKRKGKERPRVGLQQCSPVPVHCVLFFAILFVSLSLLFYLYRSFSFSSSTFFTFPLLPMPPVLMHAHATASAVYILAALAIQSGLGMTVQFVIAHIICHGMIHRLVAIRLIFTKHVVVEVSAITKLVNVSVGRDILATDAVECRALISAVDMGNV